MKTLIMEEFPVFYYEEPVHKIAVMLILEKHTGFNMDGFIRELQMAGFSEKEPFFFVKDRLRVHCRKSEYSHPIDISIYNPDSQPLIINELLINQFPMIVQEIILKEVPLSNVDMMHISSIEIECEYGGGPSEEAIDGYEKTLVANGFVKWEPETMEDNDEDDEEDEDENDYEGYYLKYEKDKKNEWIFEIGDSGWSWVRWIRYG